MFLKKHPMVKDIRYPGRGGCDAKSFAIHCSQANGQGSMISLTTGDVEISKRLCDNCLIFKTTVSFGSVNSLCEMPCRMSHASIPSEKRTLPEDLVRLSIGIEDVKDLIADLTQALEAAANPKSQRIIDGYDSKFEDLPVVPNPNSFQRQESAPPPTSASTTVPSASLVRSPSPPSSSGSELEANQEKSLSLAVASALGGSRLNSRPGGVDDTSSRAAEIFAAVIVVIGVGSWWIRKGH
jgi:hypothetical protein